MLKVGFQIADKQLLWEFEFKGKKVFQNVKASNYFVDNIPACYLIYYDSTMKVKIPKQRPKL